MFPSLSNPSAFNLFARLARLVCVATKRQSESKRRVASCGVMAAVTSPTYAERGVTTATSRTPLFTGHSRSRSHSSPAKDRLSSHSYNLNEREGDRTRAPLLVFARTLGTIRTALTRAHTTPHEMKLSRDAQSRVTECTGRHLTRHVHVPRRGLCGRPCWNEHLHITLIGRARSITRRQASKGA